MMIDQTKRERFRRDFNITFLHDLVNQVAHGHDPRNYIGLRFGHNNPRAFQIWVDRVSLAVNTNA